MFMIEIKENRCIFSPYKYAILVSRGGKLSFLNDRFVTTTGFFLCIYGLNQFKYEIFDNLYGRIYKSTVLVNTF